MGKCVGMWGEVCWGCGGGEGNVLRCRGPGGR